jgi:hypothetical protein
VSIVYQLKIELVGSHPNIWRKIIVPGDTPFQHLHDVIQISMGWKDEYPFTFNINEITVRDFGPELDMEDNSYDRDAMGCALDDLVSMVKTRFFYTRTFHNAWEHRITVEKIFNAKEEPEHPVCIGGERGCPPDDCGGISRYQDMLNVLADEKHPDHNNIKKQLGEGEDVALFNIAEVNAKLRHYANEWDKIYDETERVLARLKGEYNDDELDDPEDEESEYESLKHLRSPQDLLNDVLQKQEMDYWISDALATKNSVEYKTFARLVGQGHGEEKSRAMILGALSIEWFYDLKYGTNHVDDRYKYNLDQLPEEPGEIPSLDCAVQVLNKCVKGIPFTAIEYLHDDTSRESTSVIIEALKNFSDHQYCWEDCISTPIWYALAAEGHLCEELIDPVIGFYDLDNENATDWIHGQGQYLIGKLAQTYPDITAQKVLAAMEKDAEDKSGHAVYYLFDVFDFCNINKYKDRLIALLKRDDISWHDTLAVGVAHLQIKEGLPVLKEQHTRLKAKNPAIGTWENQHIIEIEEAIEQLETGEDLYPDVSTPLCLKRGTTWREEFADAEKHFYHDDEYFPDDNFDLEAHDYLDPELLRELSYQQPIIKKNQPGRNDPCPCGSGKKYKKCCLDNDLHEGLGIGATE